jgi:hypothetical protein
MGNASATMFPLFGIEFIIEYITILSIWPGIKNSMSRVNPSRNL